MACGYLQFNNAGGAFKVNPAGAVSSTDGSANFITGRQRIWGAGASYAFGPATVGTLLSHTQIDDMASVVSIGAGSYLPIGGNIRLDNYELNAHYAVTSAWSLSAAYTFTDGAYNDGANQASPILNTGMLQTSYALSKRSDVYLEGVYQHVHGTPAASVLGDAIFNTLSPSSTAS